MLVNLLKLPPLEPLLAEMREAGVHVRRAQPWEVSPVRLFIVENFEPGWADEISVGYANKPVSLYLAVREQRVIGFAAYECTRRAFFGPMGFTVSERGHRVGRALLVAAMWGLREIGYVYGIIGGAGPTAFYEQAVGAIPIPDSDPSIYEGSIIRAVED
jgi:hypothetical protein